MFTADNEQCKYSNIEETINSSVFAEQQQEIQNITNTIGTCMRIEQFYMEGYTKHLQHTPVLKRKQTTE